MDEKTPPQFVNTSLVNNLEQARIAAEDISTDPELLQELARSQDKATRRAVAANPNTPADALLKLGAEFPTQLVENPVFSLLLLENPNLVAEIPLPTLRNILRLDNVPLFILEQAADKADVEVQLALANNIQTSKKVLERLTQSRDAQVAESARLHVNYAGELTEGYEEKASEVIQGNMLRVDNAERNRFAVLAQICSIPHYITEYWVQNSGYKDLCSTLANSPATFPNILKQLACHKNSQIRYDVARNCRIPTDVLLKLVNDCEVVRGLGSVRSGLAGNPNTPPDILESIVKEDYSISRLKVAQNPNTPLSVIQELINDTDITIRDIATRTLKEKQGQYDRDFLKDKNTSHSLLEKFKESQPLIVASHPNALSEWLVDFSKCPNEKVREAVAGNSSTPLTILEQLANDDFSSVRCQTARNRNTPINTIFKNLARDTWVVSIIGYEMSKKQYYESPEKHKILDILAEESTSPLETILQRLIQEGEEAARMFLASRFDLPAHQLAQLAQAGEYKVREAVAKNPSTPVEILAYLASDKQYKVRLAVAENPNTSTVVLEEFAKNGENELRFKAMLNYNLSKEAVERILCEESATDYLKLNPDFLLNNLDSLNLVINHYTNYKFHIATYVALLQPQVDKETLREKSLSISWLERFAVAQNLNASLDTLNKLAQDSNQLVCAAAKQSLRTLAES